MFNLTSFSPHATRVADIVLACTDGSAENKAALTDAAAKKRAWLQRKQTYLAHLADAPDDMLLVSACDKLHNARTIVQDLENPKVGAKVFDRFKSGRDGTLAYYESLLQIFTRRGTKPVAQLESAVAQMHSLAGVPERQPLEPATPA